jgi:superfamily I DNA/RNA helicase
MALINLSGVQTTRAIAPPSFQPSPQQLEIFRAVEEDGGNFLIEAVAGSGKTSTLIEVCKRLRDPAIFLAFNKAIAGEIGAKLAAAGISPRQVKSATFHSVGFQAWARHAPKAVKNVRGEKLSLLAEKISIPQFLRPFAVKAASLGKQALIGTPVGPVIDDDEAWLQMVEHFDLLDLIPEVEGSEDPLGKALAWSVRLLQQSVKESDSCIDFDDMMYMPLYCGLPFWQYPWVLVDEAQDTNVSRRVFSERLLRPGGRFIAVGDPHQAIYGFAGADADALARVGRTFSCQRLPLTVTYRCPRAVVAHAQQFVSHIQAAENAPEGIVRSISEEDFLKDPPPTPGSAIICRNVKPIVRLAFMYLRKHVPCAIEGRDIGVGLITLTKKWRSAQTLGELAVHLEEHLRKEGERLLSAHKEAQQGLLADKVDTLLVLIESLGDDRPIAELQSLIFKLFEDSVPGEAPRKIILSTIHKAKGREWDTVYLLGRNTLMPSPYAKQKWELEQENNLAYVAITRAKRELVEVNLPPRR